MLSLVRKQNNTDDFLLKTSGLNKYAQKLMVVKLVRFYIETHGCLMIEFRLLVVIGRSGVMIGRICLNVVS